jgi:cytochrome P450
MLPPRLPWPAVIQSALSLYWVEPFTAYLMRRFDTAFTMRGFGMGDIVVLGGQQAIREIFTGDRDVLLAGEANARVIPLLGRGSLLMLDGEQHLRMRRLLLPPFHGEAVRNYRALVREIAVAEVARWPSGKQFAILPSMQAIALDVILRAVLGVRDHGRLERLRSLLPRVLRVNPAAVLTDAAHPWTSEGWIGRRRPWIRARREVDRLLYEEIAAHRADPEGRDDILALLIAAHGDEGGAADQADRPLSDEELRDQLLTLLLAGHETTASSLAWCFERLLRHPDALARLERELAAGESGAFLDAVINETLRVRPVLDVVWRKLTAPLQIDGYRLPAGTLLAASIRGIQRSDAFAQPDRFRPERFLDQPAPPYTLIPFGGGPRRCIGASFAMMEMKTIVRVVLERVELRAANQRSERQSRTRSFTNVPARGARVVVTARR